MADSSKEKKLKLANSRKRFKELQELKKNRSNVQIIEKAEQESNIEESLTNSTHSSLNNNFVPENISESFSNIVPSITPGSQEISQRTSPLPNYFMTNQNAQQPARFFDHFESSTLTSNNSYTTPPVMDYFNSQSRNEENSIQPSIQQNSNQISPYVNAPGNYSLFPQGDEHTYVTDIQKITGSSNDEVCQDDPEIMQNEIQNYQEQMMRIDNSKTFTGEDPKRLLDYLNGGNLENKDALAIGLEINEAKNETIRNIQHSGAESLKQMTDQIAKRMEPGLELLSDGSITDLEKRNLELASQLEHEKLNSEKLKLANDEYQTKIAQLECELKERELGLSLQNVQEISRLKEELQAHISTVAILHAEKTELSASLAQYESVAKQKSSECEELQARLKASRVRVADLEKELNHFRSERNKNENLEIEYKMSIENLREQINSLKEQKEELMQDVLESREKLTKSCEENVNLQQQNKDLSNKLSLAEIKIQQLTSGESSNMDSEIEKLTQEKFNLEKQVVHLTEMVKTITKERDESSAQYQQYAQQLSAQINSLSSKIEQLSKDNETLRMQEQNRIKHIGELEKQLQAVQNDRISYAPRGNDDGSIKKELESHKQLISQLQVEKIQLQENFTKVSNEKDLIMKELDAKNDSVSQLEILVEQLRGNQPDSVKLLATMESNQVAASRAVEQNKELKLKMESMGEVFEKLNMDKLELTEKLTQEQRNSKELFEKLQKTELHLQTLADAIEIKDRELSLMRSKSGELDKSYLQQEQLLDRLRHYEAQEAGSQSIQNELQEARRTIVRLNNELNQLKSFTATHEVQCDRDKVSDESLEIAQLQDQLEALEMHNKRLEEETLNQIDECDHKSDKSDKNQNILDKENTVKHLEEKVKKTMQEIADLTEEKQMLEHIVLQLQGETETIGEYVALYQHQRMMLKQKALEKDQQLKQLANDREIIKSKLDRLNQLIKKLVNEKGEVPKELLQHQEDMKSHSDRLCEEHSKINDELNKITENNYGDREDNSESVRTETAQEIIELLGEIKTSNLVQPDENYHHCPYCSGQLITV